MATNSIHAKNLCIHKKKSVISNIYSRLLVSNISTVYYFTLNSSDIHEFMSAKHPHCLTDIIMEDATCRDALINYQILR